MRAIDLADAVDELEAADLSDSAREVALSGLSESQLEIGRRHQRVITKVKDILAGGRSLRYAVSVTAELYAMSPRWVERLWQHHLRYRVPVKEGPRLTVTKTRHLGDTRANH